MQRFEAELIDAAVLSVNLEGQVREQTSHTRAAKEVRERDGHGATDLRRRLSSP